MKKSILLQSAFAIIAISSLVNGADCYDDGANNTTMRYTGQGGTCGTAPACSGTITLSYAMRDEPCPSGTTKASKTDSNVAKQYYNEYYGCTNHSGTCGRNSSPSSRSNVVSMGTVIRCVASGNPCPTPTPDPTPPQPE